MVPEGVTHRWRLRVGRNGVERRLAAILSADVFGYSRLMAEDEDGTVRRLTHYREEIAMLVRQHRGRVVDSPGDEFLAEFPTATDAMTVLSRALPGPA
jgi:adenylate cyclase